MDTNNNDERVSIPAIRRPSRIKLEFKDKDGKVTIYRCTHSIEFDLKDLDQDRPEDS